MTQCVRRFSSSLYTHTCTALLGAAERRDVTHATLLSLSLTLSLSLVTSSPLRPPGAHERFCAGSEDGTSSLHIGTKPRCF